MIQKQTPATTATGLGRSGGTGGNILGNFSSFPGLSGSGTTPSAPAAGAGGLGPGRGIDLGAEMSPREFLQQQLSSEGFQGSQRGGLGMGVGVPGMMRPGVGGSAGGMLVGAGKVIPDDIAWGGVGKGGVGVGGGQQQQQQQQPQAKKTPDSFSFVLDAMHDSIK